MKSAEAPVATLQVLRKLTCFLAVLAFLPLSVYAAKDGSIQSDMEQAKNAFYSGDLPQAQNLFSKLTANERAESYYYLALIRKRQTPNLKADFKRVDLLQKSAKAGHLLAMWELGEAYENGYGVEQDVMRARDWYRKAEANREQPDSLVFYSDINDRSSVIPPSEIIARLQKKADSGDAEAQYQLGKMYDTGQLLSRNSQKAFYWYKKAAMSGHGFSQYILAYFYCRGIAVERDAQRANYWLMESDRTGECKPPKGVRK